MKLIRNSFCSLIGSFLLLSGLPLNAQDSIPSESSGITAYQERYLEIERAKLAKEDLRSWLTAFSIGVSLLLPLIVVVISLRTQARHAFELKAAEIVLSSRAPYAAERRAKILKALFPHRFSESFAKSFDTSNFPGTLLHELKIELFRAQVSNIGHSEQVIEIWKRLFDEPKINKLFDKPGSPTTKLEKAGTVPGDALCSGGN